MILCKPQLTTTSRSGASSSFLLSFFKAIWSKIFHNFFRYVTLLVQKKTFDFKPSSSLLYQTTLTADGVLKFSSVYLRTSNHFGIIFFLRNVIYTICTSNYLVLKEHIYGINFEILKFHKWNGEIFIFSNLYITL